MKRFLIAGLLLGLLATSCQKESEKIVLKAGHVLDTSHPSHKALEFMAKRLAEKSGGRVELRIYPSGQLGGSRELIEQVQLGIITMTPTSTASLESFKPELGVFSLPYIFRDSAHYWQVLEGETGKGLLDCSEVGLKGLCYFDAGSRSFYMKDAQLRTPDDLAGKKIRVMQNRTSIAMIDALGGSPTPISFGELYSALQQGVVDGAENNPPSFLTSGHYEVCKYYTLDEHTRIPDLLAMSEEKWQSFPPDLQKMLTEVAAETSQYQRRIWKEMSDNALATLKKKKVSIITPDKSAFMEKVEKLHDSYQGTTTGTLIKRIKEQSK